MTSLFQSIIVALVLLAWAPVASAQDHAAAVRALGMIDQPCAPDAAVAERTLSEPNHIVPRDETKYAADVAAAQDRQANDWAWLCRYQAENARLRATDRVKLVFMGDSITEGWAHYDPSFFTRGRVDRGIAGQTSAQMILRFYQDVIMLRPEAVHIMAGTNDLAGNTGPTSVDEYENNIRAMVDLAKANGVRIILSSILPTNRFPWRPELKPASRIRELNKWLQTYAAEKGELYLDYYALMVGPDGGMRPELTYDGVHPGTAGYRLMRQAAEDAIVALQPATPIAK